jgi:hypothetical protein
MPFRRGQNGGRPPRDPSRPWTARVEGIELGDFATEAEALKIEETRRALLLRLGDPELLTVAEYVEHRWLQENPRPSDDTNMTYQSAIRSFVRAFGHVRLIDLTVGQVGPWMREQENPRPHRIASTMLSDARYWGLLEVNPIEQLTRGRRHCQPKKAKKAKRPKVEPLTPTLVVRLENAAYRVLGPDWWAAVRFNSREALRRGEFGALWHADVDLSGMSVRIDRQLAARAGDYQEPKAGSFRTIPLFPDAAEAYASVSTIPGRPRVWRSIRGVPLTRSSMYDAWDKIRKDAGVPHSFKHLRAHAATRLKMRASTIEVRHFLGEQHLGGVDDGSRERVRDFLGHTDTRISDKHYTEFWHEELNDQIRRLFLKDD